MLTFMMLCAHASQNLDGFITQFCHSILHVSQSSTLGKFGSEPWLLMPRFPMSPRHVSEYVFVKHYSDVKMGAMAPQITSLSIVYSTVSSPTDQRNHQSSASLAFVRWIHRWPGNSPHKWPVTRKMFPFDDAIVLSSVFGKGYLSVHRVECQ